MQIKEFKRLISRWDDDDEIIFNVNDGFHRNGFETRIYENDIKNEYIGIKNSSTKEVRIELSLKEIEMPGNNIFPKIIETKKKQLNN